MKKIFFASILLYTFTNAFADITFTCDPETGSGNEVVTVSIDNSNLASISVNDSREDLCGKGAVKGELVEYGEGELQIQCKNGLVYLIQNYDEMSLDIESLKLKLSDTIFMCN